MDQLTRCLDGKMYVISTCEELAYPFRTHPQLAETLDSLAKSRGVALVGTGVNPGFVMDKLIVTLAAVCQRVDQVKAMRVVDASTRRLPLQKKIGAGMDLDAFRSQVSKGLIKHVGLPESLAMVADALGLPIEEIKETIEPVLARKRIKTQFLTVEPGQVAGLHQKAVGFQGRKPLIQLELQMYVGAENPNDCLELEGSPHMTLVIPGGSPGDTATASMVVNSIPKILTARAGLRTSLDLAVGFLSPTRGLTGRCCSPSLQDLEK